MDLDALFNKNEFRICNICQANKDQFDKRKKFLEDLDPKASIYVACQSMCGPGAKKKFVIINNRPVFAETEEELQKAVKEYLGK